MTSTRYRLSALCFLTALLLVAACGGDSATGSTDVAAAATTTTSGPSAVTTLAGASTTEASAQEGDECPSLTATDVQTITGVEVVAVPRGSDVGAGGMCANYQTTAGDGFIGVNVLTGADSFELSFPPEGAYQPAEDLAGIGDEAVGFRLLAGYPLTYVVARQGENVVVVFSLSQEITDDQMTQMATKALG
jgi:hypothetical protein